MNAEELKIKILEMIDTRISDCEYKMTDLHLDMLNIDILKIKKDQLLCIRKDILDTRA